MPFARRPSWRRSNPAHAGDMGWVIVRVLRRLYEGQGRADLVAYIDDHDTEIASEAEDLVWAAMLKEDGAFAAEGAAGFAAALAGKWPDPPMGGGARRAYAQGYVWAVRFRNRLPFEVIHAHPWGNEDPDVAEHFPDEYARIVEGRSAPKAGEIKGQDDRQLAPFVDASGQLSDRIDEIEELIADFPPISKQRMERALVTARGAASRPLREWEKSPGGPPVSAEEATKALRYLLDDINARYSEEVEHIAELAALAQVAPEIPDLHIHKLEVTRGRRKGEPYYLVAAHPFGDDYWTAAESAQAAGGKRLRKRRDGSAPGGYAFDKLDEAEAWLRAYFDGDVEYTLHGEDLDEEDPEGEIEETEEGATISEVDAALDVLGMTRRTSVARVAEVEAERRGIDADRLEREMWETLAATDDAVELYKLGRADARKLDEKRAEPKATHTEPLAPVEGLAVPHIEAILQGIAREAGRNGWEISDADVNLSAGSIRLDAANKRMGRILTLRGSHGKASMVSERVSMEQVKIGRKGDINVVDRWKAELLYRWPDAPIMEQIENFAAYIRDNAPELEEAPLTPTPSPIAAEPAPSLPPGVDPSDAATQLILQAAADVLAKHPYKAPSAAIQKRWDARRAKIGDWERGLKRRRNPVEKSEVTRKIDGEIRSRAWELATEAQRDLEEGMFRDRPSRTTPPSLHARWNALIDWLVFYHFAPERLPPRPRRGKTYTEDEIRILAWSMSDIWPPLMEARAHAVRAAERLGARQRFDRKPTSWQSAVQTVIGHAYQLSGSSSNAIVNLYERARDRFLNKIGAGSRFDGFYRTGRLSWESDDSPDPTPEVWAQTVVDAYNEVFSDDYFDMLDALSDPALWDSDLPPELVAPVIGKYLGDAAVGAYLNQFHGGPWRWDTHDIRDDWRAVKYDDAASLRDWILRGGDNKPSLHPPGAARKGAPAKVSPDVFTEGGVINMSAQEGKDAARAALRFAFSAEMLPGLTEDERELAKNLYGVAFVFDWAKKEGLKPRTAEYVADHAGRMLTNGNKGTNPPESVLKARSGQALADWLNARGGLVNVEVIEEKAWRGYRTQIRWEMPAGFKASGGERSGITSRGRHAVTKTAGRRWEARQEAATSWDVGTAETAAALYRKGFRYNDLIEGVQASGGAARRRALESHRAAVKAERRKDDRIRVDTVNRKRAEHLIAKAKVVAAIADRRGDPPKNVAGLRRMLGDFVGVEKLRQGYRLDDRDPEVTWWSLYLHPKYMDAATLRDGKRQIVALLDEVKRIAKRTPEEILTEAKTQAAKSFGDTRGYYLGLLDYDRNLDF